MSNNSVYALQYMGRILNIHIIIRQVHIINEVSTAYSSTICIPNLIQQRGFPSRFLNWITALSGLQRQGSLQTRRAGELRLARLHCVLALRGRPIDYNPFNFFVF
jgi:hypothetical protein